MPIRDLWNDGDPQAPAGFKTWGEGISDKVDELDGVEPDIPTGLTSTDAVLHVLDQKATGTAGQSITSGAWRTRDLQTVKRNEIADAAVASNQVTLPAGKYWAEWWTALDVGGSTAARYQTRLRDTAGDETTLAVGGAGRATTTAGVGVADIIQGEGYFELSAEGVLEVQVRVNVTITGGIAANFDEPEVYTSLTVWRVGDAA